MPKMSTGVKVGIAAAIIAAVSAAAYLLTRKNTGAPGDPKITVTIT
jgi:hypothetical protein